MPFTPRHILLWAASAIAALSLAGAFAPVGGHDTVTASDQSAVGAAVSADAHHAAGTKTVAPATVTGGLHGHVVLTGCIPGANC